MNILLICGGGASSGFLVQKMRKAAKKQKIEVTINARSQSVLSEYVNEIDVLLIGPHLKFAESDFKKIMDGTNVPYAFIEEMAYATLDGATVLKQAIEVANTKK